MDPDAEVKARRLPTFKAPDFVAAALIASILGAGIALRVARFSVGDYYEDGASHWWTAAGAMGTGVLVDPFNHGTAGYWLPGYDHLAVAAFQVTGTTQLVLLRWIGVAFFVAIEFALWALAVPAGRGVALFAMALMAVSPFDTVDSPIAIGLEPAVAFLLAGLVLHQRARGGRDALLIGASVFYTLAVLFRYEAAVFVGALALYNWWWSGGRPMNQHHLRRELPYLLFPLAVALLFLALTWGHNLPSRFFVGTPPEMATSEALGYLPQDPIGRNASFWGFWIAGMPVAIALAAIGIVRHSRRVEVWLIVTFVALLSIFMVANLGTPSIRYMATIEPLLWFMAALGAREVGRWVKSLSGIDWRGGAAGLVRKGGVAACALALVASCVYTGEATLLFIDQRVALHGPLYRAASFLADQPQNESLLVLIDSPLAAEASGLPATRLIGSRSLPVDRDGALAFLKERVQYVMAVNVSYYPLIEQFPELGHGQSTPDFSLLYDATSWEIAYSSKTAFVYRVNHETGVLGLGADYQLSFPFHQWNEQGDGPGVQLLYRGLNVTEGSTGLGFPLMRVDGRDFAPAELEGRFTPDAPTNGFDVDYTLYARDGAGSLETQGPSAVVHAFYRVEESGLSATFVVAPPPGTTSFSLRANNTVPGSSFPSTFNDSLGVPSQAPFSEGLVWSLQSWLMGERALLQFDFAAPALVWGGRDEGGDAWVAFEAPENSGLLTYPFFVLGPGTRLFKDGEPHTLRAPLFRAGGFLAGAPRNSSLRIFSDFGLGEFPYVAEGSGLPSSAFANSTSLPAERGAALQWLRAEIAYVVVVNQSGDALLALFPELANGDSNHNFSLVFDAGGPAGSLSKGLVWVFEVNRGEGFLHTDSALRLHFRFAQDSSETDVRGLGLTANGTELGYPASGLGLPSARVSGTPYVAGAATLDFVPGSEGTVVAGTFWLFPSTNGSVDRGALPLVVAADFHFAEGLLWLNLSAVPANSTDNVTLTGGFTVQTSAFPEYTNDLDHQVVTGDVPRTVTYALRNWFLGPVLTLQADYKDPYALYYSRAVGLSSSFEYEAPPGGRALQLSLWVVPPSPG